jgi:hypothetical protein
MTPCRFALAISLALLVASPAALAAPDDHSKVNGTIRVDAGEQADDLDTVNGSIKIGTGAQVGDAETVNGSIRVADRVRAGGLSTVNGSIRTGRDAQIGGDVDTVNGSIFVDQGGNIRGGVETVNGAIGLVGTDVADGIETVNGDLTVGAGSHVRGGIHYEKPGPQWISFNRRDPRVIIGPDARVDGPLVFERKVRLFVHESARIGAVTGATAVPYRGDRVPDAD